MHTIEAFYYYDKEIHLILVLPSSQIPYWQHLCCDFNFKIKHNIIEGGNTRFHSVKNGLQSINSANGIIGIHDGVRPLVNQNTIKNTFDAAIDFGAAIPVVKINDTIRHLEKENSKTVNRDLYRLVQTPQCFRLDIIKKAYEQEYQSTFTDDASVVENLNTKICLTEGNLENIKITTPLDLKYAEILINNQFEN